MPIVTLHTADGPVLINSDEVIWVTQPPLGGWATVLVKGGKSHKVVGTGADVGKALECYLQGDDQGVNYWINEDSVTHVSEGHQPNGQALTLFLPDNHFMVVPGATEVAFRYALECAKANREGQPLPPPPEGVRVHPN